MLWLSENYIRVFHVEKNENGGVRASGSVREKDKDGNVSYKSFNLRFGKNVADRAAVLADKTLIKMLRGGVDLYPSTKYKTDKGAPVMLPYVLVNDFEVVNFDNNSDTETLSQAIDRQAQERKMATPPAPPKLDDEDPFATV